MNDERESTGGSRPLSDRAHDMLWHVSPTVGLALAVFSLAVLFFTFPMRFTHTIFVKSLVGVFGEEFALIFIALQLGMFALMRCPRGMALAAALFAVGMGLGWIGMNWSLGYHDVDVAGFTAARHILGGGAIASGLGTGLALYKGAFARRTN